jgi:uncharacterized protein (DUF58 family)
MKKLITSYIGNLYITTTWYLVMTGLVIAFFLSFFIAPLLIVAALSTASVLLLTVTDYCLLFLFRGSISILRIVPARFSLGDDNHVALSIVNKYRFKISLVYIDELPIQFQDRNFQKTVSMDVAEKNTTGYTLRPVARGVYEFGCVIAYVQSPLHLLQRRFNAVGPVAVKVYPSFLQLKKYQLMASTDSYMAGAKKDRRLGNSLEFEKIKSYVPGDDVRTINWKATARSSSLMVNTFTDARQQQIYCVIDKGRSMKMPFNGMTLLDYSINATLALLNIALLKQDKAGLITFANTVTELVLADRSSSQINRIVETLYLQQTDFKESDYEGLWFTIHKRIAQRSLLLLFTNFETYSSLERQLPSLRKMATRHLVCVIFFQNTLLKEIKETNPDNIEGIYIKTIAEQFDFEKRQIVRTLRQHGIISILTTPQDLSADVINKYLEIKARQMI